MKIENNQTLVTQPKWRSPVAWGALLALFYFVTKNWVGFDIPNFDEFVTLLMAAAVGFGIFNSPDKKNAY